MKGLRQITGSQSYRIVTLILASLCCCLLLLMPASLFSAAFAVIAALAAVFYRPAFIPMVLTSALSSSIGLGGGVAAVFFFMFLLFVSLFVDGGFKLHVTRSRSYLYLALFCVWMLFCGVNSVAGDIYTPARLVIFILLGWLIAESGKLDFDKCIDAVVWTSPLILVSSLVKLLFNPCMYEIEGAYRTTYRPTIADGINPNQFAPYISVLCVILFVNLLKRRKWYYAVLVLLAIAMLAVINSRTSFYGAAAICLCCYLFRYKTKKSRKVFVCIAVALALLLSILVMPSDDSYDERSLSLSSIVIDSGSGRFFTWADVVTDIIPNYPVTGIGVGKDNFERIGFDFDSDNLYMDLLAEVGILGFILFSLFFGKLLVDVSHKAAHALCVVIALLWLQLVLGLGETVFDSQLTWTVVMMAMLFLRRKQ